MLADWIVRATVIAVLLLAALNALHGAALIVRLMHRLAHRQPQAGLGLWLPAFATVDDVRAWLEAWRKALSDPSVAVLRGEARTVVGRHVYLALLSHTWALALTAIAPHLA